jgi:hypothetical protein
VCRNIQEDASMDAEISNGDNQSSGESPSVEKVGVADPDTIAVIYFWSFSAGKIIAYC